MRVRFLLVLACVAAAAFVAAGSGGAATNRFCQNDVLAAGAYQNVVVSGYCNLASSGSVIIHGSLFITGDGVFNGETCAFMVVQGGISVSARGVLALDGSCEDKDIFHGIAADRPNAVVLHSIDVSANGIWVTGGGGGPTGACERKDVPLFGVPYNVLEDSSIGGNVTFDGYRGCWQGMFRNSISGTVTYTNNTVEDPDGNEIADNSIGGNLFCKGNIPKPQFGDSGGGFNSVGGSVSPSCSPLV